jgi:5,10-methylenetetrahydrofolate reductase
VGAAVKVFILLPPRVDSLEDGQKSIVADIKIIQAKASATDVAIAGIVPQLTAINQGVGEIKADIRDIRNAKP